MITITSSTIAEEFTVYFGAAFFGMFILLKNNNSSSFRENKPVTVPVERS